MSEEVAVEHQDGARGRLKKLADATGRRVAEQAKTTASRVAESVGDAQQAARQVAVQAMDLADAAGQQGDAITRAVASRTTSVASDAQDAAKRAADQAMAKAEEVTDAVSSRVRSKRKETLDLSQLSDDAKLFYCRALGDLALVDGHLDPREISNLYLFASTIGLGIDGRAALRAEITGLQGIATAEPHAGNNAIYLVAELLELIDPDEREAMIMMLVRDLVRISRSDSHVADEERGRIALVASLKFPDDADGIVQAAEALVTTEEEFAAGKLTTGQFEKKTKDILAKAAAFGAPIGAISLVGSVSGLGAAGITSGLAALGFGGLLGLSAMVTGIGTVVILGVVVHQGVRYLLGTSERERAQRRESLIQQVLRNHQQAMADLTDDIAALAGRMEEYLVQTTERGPTGSPSI